MRNNNLEYMLYKLLNETLFEALSIWLHPQLETIYGAGQWWEKGVYNKLSEHQQSRVLNKGKKQLNILDLQALLNVSIKNFHSLIKKSNVPSDIITPLHNIRDARNALSHPEGGKTIDPQEILYYALSAKKLLSLISADNENIEEANRIINLIMGPGYEEEPNVILGENENINKDKSIHKRSIDILAVEEKKETSVSTLQVLHSQDLKSQSQKNYEPSSNAQVNQQNDFNEVEPTQEVQHGYNDIVTTLLEQCTQNGDGFWEMILQVKYNGENQKVKLIVPNYLSKSAKSASEILTAVKSGKYKQDIRVKLLNVYYKDNTLQFPTEINSSSNKYPLIIIQPSYLINVTSLTNYEFCLRNYLMDRYSITISNQSMLRGNLVHSMFEYMLKNPGQSENFLNHCYEELDKQLPMLSMQNISLQSHYNETKPHLNALAKGLRQALDIRSIKDVFVERYMINPDLGIKGKIDALIVKKNGNWQAVELKTGKAWGREAKPGHKLQVNAYHLLLAQDGEKTLDPPCIIYTGDQAKRLGQNENPLPPSSMIKMLDFTPKNAIEIINLRNELVCIDYTGHLDFDKNENKCKGCIRINNADHCIKLHALGIDGGGEPAKDLKVLIDSNKYAHEIKSKFKEMNQALLEEFQTIRTSHGQLMERSEEYRISQFKCLKVKCDNPIPNNNELKLFFPDDNNTEFREGEPCLLSDKGGPVKGNCIEVYIAQIDKKKATVTLPSGVNELWFDPLFLDTNSPDSTFERNFAGLYELWVSSNIKNSPLEPISNYIISGNSNSFEKNILKEYNSAYKKQELSDTQKYAVRLAKGLKNILLIQGPPGTGKTYTLAEIIKTLADEGKSIGVATYTHRAADEILSKVSDIAEDLPIIKLGRIDAAAKQHHSKCFDKILNQNNHNHKHIDNIEDMLEELNHRQEHIESLLNKPNIYLGTTHAWLSGNYDTLAPKSTNKTYQQFDVMIVDEASQIITPNLAGVLRLARSWILVGDHKQLPPVIVGNSHDVLGKTLFENIAETKGLDETLLIKLNTQYRMPLGLSNFIGKTFYNDNLITEKKDDIPDWTKSIKLPLIQSNNCITLVNVEQDPNKIMQPKRFIDEAIWIKDTLLKIYNENEKIFYNSNKLRFGVIAPYKAQVALIRRELEEAFKEKLLNVRWVDIVDTVDRFQGDEREIIILSLCLRAETRKIPQIFADERRINVALSRAKFKLWVIGSLYNMKSIPTLNSFFDYAKTHPEHCVIIPSNNQCDNANKIF